MAPNVHVSCPHLMICMDPSLGKIQSLGLRVVAVGWGLLEDPTAGHVTAQTVKP